MRSRRGEADFIKGSDKLLRFSALIAQRDGRFLRVECRKRRSPSPLSRLRCWKRATRRTSPKSPTRRRTSRSSSRASSLGLSIAASIRGIGQVDFNPGAGARRRHLCRRRVLRNADRLDARPAGSRSRRDSARACKEPLAGRNSSAAAVKLYSAKPPRR